MAEERNGKIDSIHGVVTGGAQDFGIATDENEKVEGVDDAKETVVGAVESDGWQSKLEGEGINQEDILSSSKDKILPTNEETSTDLLEAVPHPQNEAAGDDKQSEELVKAEVETRGGEETEGSLEVLKDNAADDGTKSEELIKAEVKTREGEEVEGSMEVFKDDELKTEGKDDEVATIIIDEDVKVHDVPALDSVVEDVIDESTTDVPDTMRTEEELILNTEHDQAKSLIAHKSESEGVERSHPSSEHESDDVEEVKSLAPSDEVEVPEESPGSSSSVEDEELPDDETYQGLASKSTYQRNEVLELCKSLLAERKLLRKRNLLFQKMLYDYFKKKKAEGTYHEADSNFIGPGPAEFHYRKKLLVFDDMKTQVMNENINIENESKQLISEKDTLQEEAVLELDSLLKQEEALGHGLIDSQTGKILSDKVTHRLINRQGQVAVQLGEVMLKFIKIRDQVNEAEASLKSLEDFGEGLHLFDYERLRLEKRSLTEKIEERDNELSRLRDKNETLIITMTHMEQRAFGNNQLVNNCHEVLKILMGKLRDSREKRTKAQKQLIYIRSEIERLYHEAGLLAHHPLLRDFEEVLKQVETLEKEVNQMKMHVMMREKRSPHSKEESSHGLNRRSESVTHKKLKSETPRTVSRDSQNKMGSDVQKGSLRKGRPSIVQFLQDHEK